MITNDRLISMAEGKILLYVLENTPKNLRRAQAFYCSHYHIVFEIDQTQRTFQFGCVRCSYQFHVLLLYTFSFAWKKVVAH